MRPGGRCRSPRGTFGRLRRVGPPPDGGLADLRQAVAESAASIAGAVRQLTRVGGSIVHIVRVSARATLGWLCVEAAARHRLAVSRQSPALRVSASLWQWIRVRTCGSASLPPEGVTDGMRDT